jgi:hypothetical protein
MRELSALLANLIERSRRFGFEETEMYTVIGITGKTGGTAARKLLANGQKVWGVVRNAASAAEWRTRGAEIVG